MNRWRVLFSKAGTSAKVSDIFGASVTVRNSSKSSFEQDAAHKLQASQSSVDSEKPIYNEQEVREWLSTFPGGHIHVDRNDSSGTACITIEHKGRKNALSGAMMVNLADAVNSLENWKEGKLVILRGKESQFCSGGDLNFLKKISNSRASGAKLSIFMQSIASKIHHLPMLTAALVEGHTLGGGAELAIACDFRLFNSKARIGFIQSRLGFSAGFGGVTHLTRLMGPRITLQMLTSGKTIGADDAMKLGLVDFTFETSSDELLKESEKYLQEHYMKGYPVAIQAAKRAVFNVYESSYSEALNRERDIFTQLWGGGSHLHALKNVFEPKAKKNTKK